MSTFRGLFEIALLGLNVVTTIFGFMAGQSFEQIRLSRLSQPRTPRPVLGWRLAVAYKNLIHWWRSWRAVATSEKLK